MDPDAPDDTVVPETENEGCEKKPPDRPSPYRHKSSPTLPSKPRPPLPAKPRPPLPKKPSIAHVNSVKGVSGSKKSTLTRLDSTGKGKAPPPPVPTPATSSSTVPALAPKLPPKDCSSSSTSSESSISSSSKRSESFFSCLSQNPNTPPIPKKDFQTKSLNSARPKKDDDTVSPKQRVKPSISLPIVPPKINGNSPTVFPSEKHMKNKNNSNLHEHLGLNQQFSLDKPLDQSEELETSSLGDKNRTHPAPPPLKPKPKPRERPVPKRRVSVRNSSDSISELKLSLPPPPPPPAPKSPPSTIPKSPPPTIPKSPPPTLPKSPPPTIPKSPPPTIPKSPPPTIPKSPPPTIPKSPPPTIPKSLPTTIPKSPPPTARKSPPPIPVSNSIDTNNNKADSDNLSNDLSYEDDPWLDFKHDSLSLRSLENAVLSITGWHEDNNNYDVNNHNTERPSSSGSPPPRPPVPVRDYKLRSPSVDRSRSTFSERSLSSSTTTKTRIRSKSAVRSDSHLDREQFQLPRKSRRTTANWLLSDVNQNTEKPKTPIRPPRPRHEEIKRLKNKLTASDIQFVHVDFTSSKQAQELGAPISTQTKSETGKFCPPKPQRKSLVRRSRSDAADFREPSSHDIESETRSQKLSMLSQSPPSSPSSETPIPLPPKRWYPPSSNNNDEKLPSDEITNISTDHDYHEIMERRRFNSASPPTDSLSEIIKELTPPPHLPPRNYSKDEVADETMEAENPPLPDRNYRDDSDSVFNSVQKQYVEMTGANGINSQTLNTSDSNLDPSSSHTRPLSSVSQSSGSGSLEHGNTNSVLTSGSESSDEEAESENEKGKRNAKKVFYIAQEIVDSERVFVNILRLLNVDFRKAVSDATEKAGRPVIPNNMLNQILDYLPQLQNFNEVLLHDLEERLKEWDKVQTIADIFVKKGPFLKLYASYISNFENTQTLFDECYKKYPAFANVVKEFQASPVCGNLAIKHHMLKPIQRNPQYRLLLTDYLRYLEPSSPDYKNAQTALNIVSEVSNHANESIRQEDYIQKLMGIQYALIGEFEVIKPGRKLVKMGELQKLSRKEMQPRVFILFNDTLLYTTPVASGYKLNNVLKLAGMKVETPTLHDFKNEFSIISIQRSFTVCANTPLERDEWIEAFAKAIDENNLKRNSFEVNRTPVSALEGGFVLGAKAPLWVPDARVTMCMLCTCGFTVTWRRHHCRACGRVVCGNCSNNKAPLHYLDNKPNRVCDECFKSLKDDVYQQVQESKTAKEKGEDLNFPISPESLLSRFQKIRISGRSKTYIHRPAWLKEVHANDQGSTMSGYLKIYKGKKWKRLWFVLKDKVLYKYKASEDTAAITSTPLLGYEVKRFTEGTSDGSGSLDTNSPAPEPRPLNWFEGVEQGLVFELTHTGMQPMRFQTDSVTATEKWVTVMREASVP